MAGKGGNTPHRITDEDRERVTLLRIVAEDGMDALDAAQLERLQELVEKKDYAHDKKARKSKLRLLAKINVAIYERAEGRQGI